MKTFISKNSDNTYDLGKLIGKNAFDSMVILLYGDLGAGKTQITKGIAKGMNINDIISSPTYTIVHVHFGDTTLYHFDLYRLSGEDDFIDIGGYEYFNEHDIFVFEWAQRLDWDNIEHLKIMIEYIDDNSRNIILSAKGQKYEDWLGKF